VWFVDAAVGARPSAKSEEQRAKSKEQSVTEQETWDISEVPGKIPMPWEIPRSLLTGIEDGQRIGTIFTDAEKEKVYDELQKIILHSGFRSGPKSAGIDSHILHVVSGMEPGRVAVKDYSDIDLSLAVRVDSPERFKQIIEKVRDIIGLEYVGTEHLDTYEAVVRFKPTSELISLGVKDTVDIFVENVHITPENDYEDRLARAAYHFSRPMAVIENNNFPIDEIRSRIVDHFSGKNSGYLPKQFSRMWFEYLSVDYYHLSVAGIDTSPKHESPLSGELKSKIESAIPKNSSNYRQLKEDLEKVRQHRNRYRKNRQSSNIPIVAMVGYTNTGKSTLHNLLTDSNVLIADKLFATLDPTTRRLDLRSGNAILLTDTVGFIQKLPTNLVAAFRATLEEVTEADLLLHIVDINHQNAIAHYQSVINTLKEIGAGEIPVITVLNKIDESPDLDQKLDAYPPFKKATPISALKKLGIDDLLEEIDTTLFSEYSAIAVEIPYKNGQLISLFHRYGQVIKVEHGIGSVTIEGKIPGRLKADFNRFLLNKH